MRSPRRWTTRTGVSYCTATSSRPIFCSARKMNESSWRTSGLPAPSTTRSNLTQTGMVVATIAYAAPESLSGYTVDGRADIYSLGCSLYNLLTQRTPFGGSGGMAATMAAHLNHPPPRVTDLVPALPAPIDQVIARAMAKNPADRYQTAREMAAAAAQALEGTHGTRCARCRSRRQRWSGQPTTTWSPRATPIRQTQSRRAAFRRMGSRLTHAKTQPPVRRRRSAIVRWRQGSSADGKRRDVGHRRSRPLAVVAVIVGDRRGDDRWRRLRVDGNQPHLDNGEFHTDHLGCPRDIGTHSAPPAPANVDDARAARTAPYRPTTSVGG